MEPVSQKPVLVWGILAIAFSCTPILGIIFSIIALNKVKKYVAAGGQLVGGAKVGRILAKIALPLSIVMTVLYVICIVIIAVAAKTYGTDFLRFIELYLD